MLAQSSPQSRRKILAEHAATCVAEYAPVTLYILRTIVSLILTWISVFYLNLDKPVWALLTVLIVAEPRPGDLVPKFIARLIGTVVGAITVTFIAFFALGSPLVMSFCLAGWLAVCAYGASFHSGMVRYGFALSGYTAAILGFALSLNPTAYMVFYITQARVSAVVLGLTCSLVVSLLFPYTSGKKQVQNLVQSSQRSILQLFKDLALRRQNQPEIGAELGLKAGFGLAEQAKLGLAEIKAGLKSPEAQASLNQTETQSSFAESETNSSFGLTEIKAGLGLVVHKLMQLRQIVVHQSFSLPTQQSAQCYNDAAVYEDLHALSDFFGLRKRYAALQAKKYDGLEAIDAWLGDLERWFDTLLARHEAQIEATQATASMQAGQDQALLSTASMQAGQGQGRALLPPIPAAPKLAGKEAQEYIALMQATLGRISQFSQNGFFAQRYAAKSPRTVYRDKVEPLINSARTLVATLLAVAFWLEAQWDIGYIFPILIGVGCCLGGTYPKVNKLVYLALVAGLFSIGIAAFLQFVLYIQVNPLVALIAATLPFIVMFSYGKFGSIKSFFFWHVCSVCAFFLIAYDNTMTYSYSGFVNSSLAIVVCVVALALIYNFMPQSPETAVFKRMQAEISQKMQAAPRPFSLEKRLEIEALLYSAIAQAYEGFDASAKDEFMAFAVNVLEEAAE